MQQTLPEDDREDPAVPPSRTPEDFAERYAERVHRFALLVSPPGCEAEDLAQDALVRALRGLDTFDPALGSMDGWLWRIVVNLARDAGRVSGRAALRLERLVAWAGPPASEESAEVLAIRQIGDRELLDAVRRLPARYRTVIALRFGAGLTQAEIGVALGVSRIAVAHATRRALDRLRGELEVQS